MRVAEDRVRWQEIGEAYVQQWTVVLM
jgi:hypothetical protein